jgi:hypothetical protein
LKSAAGKIASDLAALLVPVTVAALSRHAILDQFWLYDDAFHLRYVSHHTVAQYFVSPSAWRELPFRSISRRRISLIGCDWLRIR